MRVIYAVLMLGVLATPALAQGPAAFNEALGLDLAGNYRPIMHEDAPERGGGPKLVDYLGIPLTEGARAYGLAWDASRFSIPEHQCEPHSLFYIHRGPHNLRIWEDRHPDSQRLVAIRFFLSNYEQNRTIWMDGRSHPPAVVPHTYMGFSTGKWDGNMLIVTTTHLKEGWMRRNGLRYSDQATVTEYIIRRGTQFTLTSILTDPATLTEPLIRTTDFEHVPQNGQAWLYPCEEVVEIDRPHDVVPHHLPGENPFVREFADDFKIPAEAALGGAETMYPEYQSKLKGTKAK